MLFARQCLTLRSLLKTAADYKPGLSNDPPLVAGKSSLRDVLDLPEYRSAKERALGFLRIPMIEAGPFSLEYLGGLWRRMISV